MVSVFSHCTQCHPGFECNRADISSRHPGPLLYIIHCSHIFKRTGLFWGTFSNRTQAKKARRHKRAVPQLYHQKQTVNASSLTFSWCCVWGSSPSGCASSVYQTESGCSDSSAPYSNSTPARERRRTMLLYWQMLLCIPLHGIIFHFLFQWQAERWVVFVKEELFHFVLTCFYLLEVFLAELFEFFWLFLQELQIALLLLELLHTLDLNVWGHGRIESWGWSLIEF